MPPDVPLNFWAFREVSATLESTEGASDFRTLEQIHKLLQAQPVERFAVRNTALAAAASSSAPTMLLGIMSGNEVRRRVLRCTWTSRVQGAQRAIRVLFVVGSASPLSAEWELAPPEAMELRVNVSEGVRLFRGGHKPRTGWFTGTFSTYLKQASFLRFAATQPEPLVGRADDDAFISPHMLLAYATLLSRLQQPFYGGVFEWISWRAARLEATGFSYGLAEARGRAKAPHRNCSRTAPDAESDAYDHVCVGPLAYAKGPLLMMNQLALRWLVRAPVFHRDLRLARDMAEGRAVTRKGRIDDDINLGFWMARMPNLRLLRLRRVVWKDTWRDGADASLLLSAHKLPWRLHAELYNTTSAMWASATAANVVALCRADAPPCTSCSHARSQRVCILEIGIETPIRASRCVRAPRRGDGCPVFVRESHPTGFELC